MIDGYIGVYQITFDEEWLDEALKLTAYAIEHLYDAEDELFYFTDTLHDDLIARKKEIFDNVIPASNSLMAHNLYTLGMLVSYDEYVELADWMLSKLKRSLMTDVQWVTNWAALYVQRAHPTAEVVLVGPDIEAFRKEFEETFWPNKIIVGATTASDLPLLEGRMSVGDKTTVYICSNKTCQLPVHSVAAAIQQLQNS